MSPENNCAFKREEECGIARICADLILSYKQGGLEITRFNLDPQLVEKLEENRCVVPIFACAVQKVKDGSPVVLFPCLAGVKGVNAQAEDCQYFVPKLCPQSP